MEWIGISVILAAIDLMIKNEIELCNDHDFPKELSGTGGKVILHKNHNYGFSFGILKQKPELVKILPLAAASFLAGIMAYLLTKKGHMIEKFAMAMALGGAASNLCDRMVRHYVVDYFSISYKRLKQVVFNLGDIFIFAGAVLMLLMELIKSLKDK